MNLLARSKLARHLISPSLAIQQCNCYCTKAKNQVTKEPPSAKKQVHRVQECMYQPQAANLVTLIGRVTEPVQFEPSIEGGLAAIVISQGSRNELEIPVIFEGDLAHAVAFHVRVNDCVFVSGKVSVDPVRPLLNKGLGEFHVVAKDLDFVDGFPGVKIGKKSVKSEKIVDENDCQDLNKEAVDKADAYTAVKYSSAGAGGLYSDAEPVLTSESRDDGMEFRRKNGTYIQKLELDVPGGKTDAERGLAVKKQTKKEKQAAKDPNKPKRPPSAFFVFMEDFRKQYKEKHPNNKSVAAVGKAGGEKWKSFSDEDKAQYVAKAEKRKAEYERQMEAYNNKLAGGDDEESDKSKSEVHDEDEDECSAEEDEDDD